MILVFVILLLFLALIRGRRALGRVEGLAWIVGWSGFLACIAWPLLFLPWLPLLALWHHHKPAGEGTLLGAPIVSPEVLIVVPALNEAESLKKLLPGAPHDAQVLVIDDGSTDNTGTVALEGGAGVLRSDTPRGGGHALRLGFAVAQKVHARFVVTMDADGQHRFEDLPAMLLPLQEDRADLVVGSRRLGRSVGHTAVRSLGVDVFNRIIALVTGRGVTDCSSGYRALRTDILSDMKLREDRHHTAEMLIEAARRGLRVAEAPVTILPRTAGETRKGSDWRYGLRFAGTIVRAWWG